MVGATGPQNVFFNNTLTKQLAKGGDYTPFYPDHQRIYQFAWNGTGYQHLTTPEGPIPDWAGREQLDYTSNGVDASRTDAAESLFLAS
ncbi:hypothetical protein [Actinokineospora iranica]|uniref:Uncharacterized protein n=1 Tax=Actinokineospora iranica TaxID=1271860 RepID=A0A1G6WMD6_9PSEU|nr:hypothetical protein [Actinokineospora iranica]SDD67008.1 hypothetical protein SAMN05216174_11583 [Actinokineospora iranica]